MLGNSNIWIGNSNAKCKRAKQEFYSPLQTFSLAPAWAECKKKYFIGLTLKCQISRGTSVITFTTKPPHSSDKAAPLFDKAAPPAMQLCYLKMLAGNSNAKCKGPKNDLGGTNKNFIHPCKHFRWPQLGRSATFIGLTLKCPISRGTSVVTFTTKPPHKAAH